jgi:simple sugar transport system permease protein
MFGRATPIGVLGASLLFGFAYALTLRLQSVGIPPQFVAMLPYLATIVVLVAVAVRARARRRAVGAIESEAPERLDEAAKVL